jgi:hypothetical protein
MTKILTAIAFLLVSAGSAFGATADFIFLNKLALLIGANVVLGALLAFCAFVIASHLWDKLKGGRLPVRVRTAQQRRTPNRHSRTGAARRSRNVINE